MKKSLVMIVGLLATASLMAAMAFSTAQVPNNVQTAIVNTDKALVSIVENENFTDFAKIGDDGKMNIDFTKGSGNVTDSGFQPGSSYIFNDLFYLKNNITKDIQIGVRFDQVYPGDTNEGPQGLHVIQTDKKVEGYHGGDYMNALVHFNGNTFTGGYNEGRYITLKPGESIGLDWSFDNNNKLGVESSSSLQVHAKVVGR